MTKKEEQRLAYNFGWELMKLGKYQEAVEHYERLYPADQPPQRFGRHARALPNLMLGNYESAYHDFLLGRTLMNPSGAPYKVSDEFVGTALWLMGEPGRACADWADQVQRVRSGELTHSTLVDEAALLWWGACHPVLQADPRAAEWERYSLETLVQKWRQEVRDKRSSEWPYPIAPFLTGQIDGSALLARAEDSQFPRVGRKHRFQALFYILARFPHGSDIQVSILKEALMLECDLLVQLPEYHLARQELGVR